jgi:ABC-type Fe3+/spermidine/putrescine transport system ATPase subunit
MHAGQIRQIGTPRDIYVSPKSDVVAGFIGMANLLQAKVERLPMNGEDGTVTTVLGKLKCKLPASLSVGETVTVMFRPEDVVIGDLPPRCGDNVFLANVKARSPKRRWWQRASRLHLKFQLISFTCSFNWAYCLQPGDLPKSTVATRSLWFSLARIRDDQRRDSTLTD